MAGTMPHAVFVETDWDGAGGCAAYAAELPGCATFGAAPAEAVAAIPRRVAAFVSWLTAEGERLPSYLGDNWYEVEREAAVRADGAIRRATFSLDELSPSDEEFTRWTGWLELAREALAEALDRGDPQRAADELGRIAGQDLRFVAELSGTRAMATTASSASDDPLERLFLARDALGEALETRGPSADGARRILRVAIADDLRVAELLQGGGER